MGGVVLGGAIYVTDRWELLLVLHPQKQFSPSGNLIIFNVNIASQKECCPPSKLFHVADLHGERAEM